MNISLKKTVAQLDRCLQDGGENDIVRLHRMYDLTLRLQSQLLSVIYDMETFGGRAERIANAHNSGKNKNFVVTLTITELLPSMKRLTEAVEEHWKAMLHAAIVEVAQQEPLRRLGGGEKKVLRLSVFWTLTNCGKLGASHEDQIFDETKNF